MIHLNGNILCAVDCETTGLDDKYNDMIEFACCPLNSRLEPHEEIMPFACQIIPRFPERVEEKAMRVNKIKLSDLMINGLDNLVAGDAFIEWFENLNLREGKRLMPLAQVWSFDKGFIKEWLGKKNFEYIFHYHARDTCATALFLNDRADQRNEKIPFPKVSLQYLASQLNVPTERTHRATEDAITTAGVYRRLLQQV